jgi:hypothetical protein
MGRLASQLGRPSMSRKAMIGMNRQNGTAMMLLREYAAGSTNVASQTSTANSATHRARSRGQRPARTIMASNTPNRNSGNRVTGKK